MAGHPGLLNGVQVPRPVNIEAERKRLTPRSLLVDHTAFGLDRKAPWHPASELETSELSKLVVAYWQHLAVCTVRKALADKGLRRPAWALHELLVEHGFSEQTRRDHEHLGRVMSGAYTARFHELVNWALVLSDVSILPQPNSIDEMFPPGALPPEH